MSRWLQWSYFVALYVFFYLPITVLVIYSFNSSGVSETWQGFTLDAYRKLLGSEALIQSALRSGMLAIASATMATVLGTLIATCLHQYQFRGRQVLSLLLFTLVISPEIVMAIGLLLLFAWSGLSLGMTSLLLSHTTLCIPFVAVMVHSRLSMIEPNIVQAAKDLGASEFEVFSKILLPLLRLTVFSGWLLSFTLSMDDVMISFFLSGATFKVLPLEIYERLRLGVQPELNALCSVLLILTLIIVIVLQFFIRHDDSN